MKANRAPEKITLSKYNITDNGDVVFAWLTNSSDCEPINHPVEYTRTDAFIEKAEKYLQEHLIDYWSQVITDESDFIENFKSYMENE